MRRSISIRLVLSVVFATYYLVTCDDWVTIGLGVAPWVVLLWNIGESFALEQLCEENGCKFAESTHKVMAGTAILLLFLTGVAQAVVPYQMRLSALVTLGVACATHLGILTWQRRYAAQT